MSGIGHLPRIGPNGELYIAFWDVNRGVKLQRSFNGGDILQAPITIAIGGTPTPGLPMVEREVRGPGRQEVVWRGRDARGQAVATGVYVWRVEAGGTVMAGRVALVTITTSAGAKRRMGGPQ